MKFEFRERDKRALLGLGLALGLYLTAAELALPLYDRITAAAATVPQKEDDLRKYRRALVSKDHYKQLLEQAKKSVAEGEQRLVRGDNPSLAEVELQTIVEEAADKINIPLGQRSVSAPKKKDEFFNEITMSLSFESTLNQLASFLAEMRSAPKVVTVRSMQVSPLQAATELPSKGELKKTVRVNLTVSALLAAREAPPKG